MDPGITKFGDIKWKNATMERKITPTIQLKIKITKNNNTESNSISLQFSTITLSTRDDAPVSTRYRRNSVKTGTIVAKKNGGA